MDITSLGFLLFLGGGVTLFYSIPQKYRWKWLIVLSFAFVYAASTIGLFFVVLTSVIVYLAAKKIEEVDDDRKKKVLIAAMGACLFILIFLKYLSGLSIFTQGNLVIFGNEMTIQGLIKNICSRLVCPIIHFRLFRTFWMFIGAGWTQRKTTGKCYCLPAIFHSSYRDQSANTANLLQNFLRNINWTGKISSTVSN